MRSRRSRTAVLERDIAQLAEHALDVARDAGHAAAPAIQSSAEGLTHAFEKATNTLLEAAGRFAQSGDTSVAKATGGARERLAGAAERFAQSIRPKPPAHRMRKLLFAVAVIGGIAALVQSPLRGKLIARLFGPPPDDDVPSSITLPNDTATRASRGESRVASEDTAVSPASGAGDGVASAPSSRADTARD